MIDPLEHGFSTVGDPVGEGGSAVVYKATTDGANSVGVEPGTTVALKMFKATILEVPNQIARIRQEAEVGGRISHPNVARAHGLIEDNNGSPSCWNG